MMQDATHGEQQASCREPKAKGPFLKRLPECCCLLCLLLCLIKRAEHRTQRAFTAATTRA